MTSARLLLASASTGSSRAAFLAGSQPNSIPVNVEHKTRSPAQSVKTDLPAGQEKL